MSRLGFWVRNLVYLDSRDNSGLMVVLPGSLILNSTGSDLSL